ncbi:hypothetical protein D3C77_414440 [compost metagenome]
MRLVIRTRALEAGQEAVVDVDGAAVQRAAHVRRQDLHVAGQHHQVGVGLVGNLQHLLFLFRLGVGRDRQVVERDAVGSRQAGVVVVVRDDGGHFGMQMAAVHAEQQIVQAVALLADHDQQAFLAARVMQLQFHAVLGGHAVQPRPQVAGGHARRHVEVHAQEEAAGFVVAELLRIQDVATQFEQQAADAVDDAGAVGAGQGQDVVVVLHGAGIGQGKDKGGMGGVRRSGAPGFLPPGPGWRSAREIQCRTGSPSPARHVRRGRQ